MQIFLFGALAISLVAVLFALQNIVPVTITFFGWTIEGSLALVLFVTLVTGALSSFLASLPTLAKGRWATARHRKQVASLEANLAECQRELREATTRLRAPETSPQPSLAPARRPDDPTSTLEPSS